MVTGSFKHGKHSVPMQLGYVLAHGKLFDLGLDVLSIMKDQSIVPTIMLDDSLMLKIWWYYISEAMKDGKIDDHSFEEALELLDEQPQGLGHFRKAFWELVVGFSSTQLQPILKQMWKETEKQLKTAVEKTSTTSTSVSQPDSE